MPKPLGKRYRTPAAPKQSGSRDATPGHRRIRQQDEYFCPKCTCRWGVDEDEPACKPITASDTPDEAPEAGVLESLIVTAHDILLAAEQDANSGGALKEDEANNLRRALVDARALLAISAPRARAANAAAVQDIKRAMDAIKFQLQTQVNPYSWAVTNFSNSALQGYDPVLVTYIKQTLRDHFAESGHSYDGWN